MTRKLEELFQIDGITQPETTIDNDITKEEAIAVVEEEKKRMARLDDAIDKIDAALPTVKDIEVSDGELDVLAELATSSFQDLMELGMNIEPGKAGEVFSTASSLLGHAITAKNAKVDKKLRIVQLQIQKARLDLQERKLNENELPEGEVETPQDRNALLAQIISMNQNKDNCDK